MSTIVISDEPQYDETSKSYCWEIDGHSFEIPIDVIQHTQLDVFSNQSILFNTDSGHSVVFIPTVNYREYFMFSEQDDLNFEYHQERLEYERKDSCSIFETITKYDKTFQITVNGIEPKIAYHVVVRVDFKDLDVIEKSNPDPDKIFEYLRDKQQETRWVENRFFKFICTLITRSFDPLGLKNVNILVSKVGQPFVLGFEDEFDIRLDSGISCSTAYKETVENFGLDKRLPSEEPYFPIFEAVSRLHNFIFDSENYVYDRTSDETLTNDLIHRAGRDGYHTLCVESRYQKNIILNIHSDDFKMGIDSEPTAVISSYWRSVSSLIIENNKKKEIVYSDKKTMDAYIDFHKTYKEYSIHKGHDFKRLENYMYTNGIQHYGICVEYAVEGVHDMNNYIDVTSLKNKEMGEREVLKLENGIFKLFSYLRSKGMSISQSIIYRVLYKNGKLYLTDPNKDDDEVESFQKLFNIYVKNGKLFQQLSPLDDSTIEEYLDRGLNEKLTAILSREPPKKEKNFVLLVGLDGFKYETFLRTNMYQKLDVVKKCCASPITKSCPSWSSMMTGVWPKDHDICHNDRPQDPTTWPPKDNVRQLLKNLQQKKLMTFIASQWGWLLKFGTNTKQTKTDQEGVDKIKKMFSKNDPMLTPQFAFLHLQGTDDSGHHTGFNDENYEKAAHKIDVQVSSILDTIEERKLKRPWEKWMVMVVTDHGGGGGGQKYFNNHGTNNELNRTTFIGTTHWKRKWDIELTKHRENVYDTPHQITHIHYMICDFFGLSTDHVDLKKDKHNYYNTMKDKNQVWFTEYENRQLP